MEVPAVYKVHTDNSLPSPHVIAHLHVYSKKHTQEGVLEAWLVTDKGCHQSLCLEDACTPIESHEEDRSFPCSGMRQSPMYTVDSVQIRESKVLKEV